MDDFWKFWDKGETADIPTRTRLFRELVILPHKEIFAGFTGEHSDEELAPYIKAMPRFVPKLRKVAARLDKEVPRQIAGFKRAFPDMNWHGTVVFMPNFGQTDSGGGMIGGKAYQFFGIDTIAFDYGENADLSVLFSHELFHLYNGQFNSQLNGKNREKGETPLYALVWNEGLATYASHRLNPQSSLDGVFLQNQTEKRSAPLLPKLAKIILENFDRGEPAVWRPFMAAEGDNKEIPPRSGYYVGYRIAEELGKKMSLRQLARLHGEELQKKMKNILKNLEKS